MTKASAGVAHRGDSTMAGVPEPHLPAGPFFQVAPEPVGVRCRRLVVIVRGGRVLIGGSQGSVDLSQGPTPARMPPWTKQRRWWPGGLRRPLGCGSPGQDPRRYSAATCAPAMAARTAATRSTMPGVSGNSPVPPGSAQPAATSRRLRRRGPSTSAVAGWPELVGALPGREGRIPVTDRPAGPSRVPLLAGWPRHGRTGAEGNHPAVWAIASDAWARSARLNEPAGCEPPAGCYHNPRPSSAALAAKAEAPAVPLSLRKALDAAGRGQERPTQR